MKTVFKKGMKVYDQLVFPNKEGKVVDIEKFDDFPIKVHHEGLEKMHVVKVIITIYLIV